jgi:phage FluMu gp28-like protein
MREMDRYFVGVDFGQTRDFTAIAVLERAETAGAWDAVAFAWKKVVSLQLRYLERIALGTPYEDVPRIRLHAEHPKEGVHFVSS